MGNISNLCEPKMEEMQGKVEFSNDVIIPQSYQNSARYVNETAIKEELVDEPYFDDQSVIEKLSLLTIYQVINLRNYIVSRNYTEMFESSLKFKASFHSWQM